MHMGVTRTVIILVGNAIVELWTKYMGAQKGVTNFALDT
jgi:hypothetical protein